MDLAAPLQTARDALDLSPLAAAALGRCLAAAVLLRRITIKTPQRLVLELDGGGPAGRVLAEVEDSGVIRRMVGAPQVELPDLPDGDLDVGRAIGSGHPGGLNSSRVDPMRTDQGIEAECVFCGCKHRFDPTEVAVEPVN